MQLMPRGALVALALVVSGVGCAASAGEPAAATRTIETLYRAHDWVGLQAENEAALSAVQRGALAAAFLRPDAEARLRAVIAAAPKSPAAFEAHQWLMHLFVQTGRYAKLAANFDAQLQSFPENQEARRDREALAGFLGLPDQETMASEPDTVRHDGGLFVPVTINGEVVNYFIDTGAGISALCESEAKRLGLRMLGTGSLGTSNSQRAGFRAAVADELVLGGTRLRHVAFAVFPDDAEPWVHLAPGRRGLIGWPVQVALRRLHWSADGTFAFGATPRTGRARGEANLCMLDDHPTVQVTIAGRAVRFFLDCGSVTTDIYSRFGTEFPAIVATGKRTRTELRSVAGAESHEAVELPDVTLRIGTTTATLKQATMLLREVGSPRVVGNLGFDVLRQSGGFSVDFETMRVDLDERVAR